MSTERRALPAAFWASIARHGAVGLDTVLQRRHAEVWERHRRGDATGAELLDAYLDAYVPPDTAARIAYLCQFENLMRSLNHTEALRAIATWRLRQQLTEKP